jgi:hypothetical protein
LRNTREAEASQRRADGTLSQNSRELEDGEVADVTELAPEGHGIAQDVEDILDADHVPSSVVDEEEPPLEQARAVTPPSLASEQRQGPCSDNVQGQRDRKTTQYNIAGLTKRPKSGRRLTPKVLIDGSPSVRDEEQTKCHRQQPMLRVLQYEPSQLVRPGWTGDVYDKHNA